MNKYMVISIIFAIFLLLNIFLSCDVKACKDIVACGDATEGDYNLLMKVRDPSRPGLQVLCIVPKGYEYTYHHPWTGKEISYTTEYKYIGVASKDDVIPNIVKAGMGLSEAGLCYGDSDTDSRWINPTKNAWDDFDWIRYACQKASTEDEAVKLLTEDAVKKMHATGVSENLFVVGPNKGFVVEGDAFHYKTKEIVNGIDVRHNYPIELWKTQWLKKRPISKSFDTTVEKSVKKNGVIRLGSLYGIKVVEIGDDYVFVKPVGLLYAMKTKSIGVVTKINLGERASVSEFSVKLIEINGNKAKIFVSNIYKAWEDEMMQYIQPRYGSITVKDMINWSRLTSEDLNGLRGVSQISRKYESTAIYKIPKYNYEEMSMGWFSPNNALSSIYVPFHICNTEVYDPYKSGDAAQLSLDLLDLYNHSILASNFSKIEDVFIYEIASIEEISRDFLRKNTDISEFLTIIDTSMQKHAYLSEELWMDAVDRQDIQDIISDLWNGSYYLSLLKMKNAILDLDKIYGSKPYISKINELALDISKSRINAAKSVGKDVESAELKYDEGEKLIWAGNYQTGLTSISSAYSEAEMTINDQYVKASTAAESEKAMDNNLFLSIIGLLIIAVIIYLIIVIRK